MTEGAEMPMQQSPEQHAPMQPAPEQAASVLAPEKPEHKPQEQQAAKVPLPPNPESLGAATLKGAVEAGATFVREAATPQSQASDHVEPVRLFDKEPQNINVPDSVRDAFRQKKAEEILGIKREEKATTPARVRAEKPQGARERKAETARAQNLAAVRTQLAKAA